MKKFSIFLLPTFRWSANGLGDNKKLFPPNALRQPNENIRFTIRTISWNHFWRGILILTKQNFYNTSLQCKCEEFCHLARWGSNSQSSFLEDFALIVSFPFPFQYSRTLHWYTKTLQKVVLHQQTFQPITIQHIAMLSFHCICCNIWRGKIFPSWSCTVKIWLPFL